GAVPMVRFRSGGSDPAVPMMREGPMMRGRYGAAETAVLIQRQAAVSEPPSSEPRYQPRAIGPSRSIRTAVSEPRYRNRLIRTASPALRCVGCQPRLRRLCPGQLVGEATEPAREQEELVHLVRRNAGAARLGSAEHLGD